MSNVDLRLVGTSDLTGQMIGAFASAAIVQSKLNSTNGKNNTYYTTLMTAATSLYASVRPQNCAAYIFSMLKFLWGITAELHVCMPVYQFPARQ